MYLRECEQTTKNREIKCVREELGPRERRVVVECGDGVVLGDAATRPIHAVDWRIKHETQGLEYLTDHLLLVDPPSALPLHYD
jgi:hypothetical protein